MIDNFEQAAEQAAAFQKLWMQSASKMVQAAMRVAPNSEPELLNQVRSSVFQVLAQSWEEFMRSPQFLQTTKQWMENAVTFRKASGDFLAKMRNEMQAPSREDVDTVMLAIRHLENRLLDRIEGISAEIAVLKSQTREQRSGGPQAKGSSPKGSRSAASPRRPTRSRRKEQV